MAKSFAETHPHNPNAKCECEHWQSCIDCHPTAHGEKYITDAMRVRQAVAQAVLQEPVEYQYRTRPDWIPEWNGWNTCSKESAEAYEKTPYLHDWHYEVRRLYTSPPVQQELVGKFAKFTDGIWREVTDGSAGVPLYTAPPQRPWVGLTDDEFDALEYRFARYELCRAIEAKLKEKNT